MIYEIITNQIIVSVFVASLICQIWKIIDNSIRNKKVDLGAFVRTGGMPSSHATFVCALAVSIGLVEGFITSIFFLAAGFAIIVVRDAFGVRRAVDDLNKTVNSIIKKKKLGIHEILKIAGHTPVQAGVGAAIGIVVPLILNIFY
jgi:acid phosphatase family membrane protein YuiD